MDCLGSEGCDLPAFLWRAKVQSGFKEGSWRMQGDHKLGIWPWRVDFRRTCGLSVVLLVALVA
jgi:hypothetical protein